MEAHKIALLAGVSMLVGGTAAGAAVLPVQSSGFTVVVSGGTGDAEPQFSDEASDVHFFDQFDASLGTLDSVKVSLGSEAALFVSVLAAGEGSTSATVDAVFNFNYTAETFDFFAGPFARQASCEGGSGCSGSSPDGVFIDDVVTFTAADASVFPIFLGNGTFGVVFESSIDLLQAPNVNTFTEGSGNSNWQGTLSVEYTFTPREAGPSVPEPATAGLLGLGALAVGAAARRRRHVEA